MSHLRKCGPSLLNSPSTAQISEHVVVELPKEINSQQFTQMERVSHKPDNLHLQSTGLTAHLFNPMGLTTRFFSPTLNSTRYMYNRISAATFRVTCVDN
jgi:hypothetical protein